MAMYSERLGTLVKQRMKEKNLSVRDVAQRSGGKLSHTTVVEIGRNQVPHPDKLVVLALALEDDPDEYLAAANKHYKYVGPRDLASVRHSLVAA